MVLDVRVHVGSEVSHAGQCLRVRLPRLAFGLQLIHDVWYVDGHGIVIADPVSRAGGGRDVIGLAGVGDAGVVGCQLVGRCRRVNPGCVRVSDQAGVTGVLHHDDKDMLIARAVRAMLDIRRQGTCCHQCERCQEHCPCDGHAGSEINTPCVAVHLVGPPQIKSYTVMNLMDPGNCVGVASFLGLR